MQLRKYCVTHMDNWTPLKYFWTFKGAKKYLKKISHDYMIQDYRSHYFLYVHVNGHWVEVKKW